MKKKKEFQKKYIILVLIIITYFSLGQLRFFVNNYPSINLIHKNYLVLLQNNNELRPNGGFISAYGELSIFMGIPYKININDSYKLNQISATEAPYPQSKLLASSEYVGYTFRDSNWNPDFQESSKEILKFYNQENPKTTINGIISVNSNILESFLKNFGSIKIEGEKYNSKNLFNLLEYKVNNIDRHNLDELAHRKDILNKIFKKIIIKSITHPFKTKNTILESFRNKDIFIWFKNNKLEQKIIKRNWGNTISVKLNQNFIATNLANLGSNKTDRYLKQEINYFLDLSQSTPIVKVNIDLIYPAKENLYSAPYHGYLRVLLPRNSEIISAPTNFKTESYNNYQAIGTIVDVKPETKASFSFQYKLPAIYNLEEQSIKIIKQSGTNPLYKIYIQNKIGSSFSNLNTYPLEVNENQIFFANIIKQDTIINYKKLKDMTPPYAKAQEFIKPNEIVIYFNEKIDPSGLNNLNNYFLIDTNKTNTITNNPEIESISIEDNKNLHLHLKQDIKQENEFFQIEIKTLKDLSGNLIQPNPRQLTIVQRLK